MALRQDRIYFDKIGTGENVLVMIHAFPVNSDMFSAVKEQMLPEGWTGIFPDLPGFGKTPEDKKRETWTMKELAAVVKDVVPLNQDITVVGGVSMGGYITEAFAKEFPELADAYILSNTRDTADADGGEGRQEVVAKIEGGKRHEYLKQDLLPRVLGKTARETDTELIEYTLNLFDNTTDKAIIQTMRGMAQREDSRAFFKTVDKPILVISGEEDELTGPEVGKEMADAYPDGRYSEIPDAGHYSALENPYAYAKTIRSFLESL